MSLKNSFAQIFSCCPKNLSCPKFGGAAAPLAPPACTPMPPPLRVRVLGLIFAGYVPLASHSPYPIIVCSVANCRPH